MNDTSNAWRINGLLTVIVVLLGAYYVRTPSQRAFAAGEGWSTDNTMAMATSGANDRMIMVNTATKYIMIYKPENNSMRLIGSRSYQYDVEIVDTDEIKVPGQGFTALQTKQLYEAKK